MHNRKIVESARKIWPDTPDFTEEMELELHRKYDIGCIFYKRQKKYVECFCTKCRTYFQLEYQKLERTMDFSEPDLAETIKHGHNVQCPHCKQQSKAYAEGRSRRQLHDRHAVVYYIPVGKSQMYAFCLTIFQHYGRIKPPVSRMLQDYEPASVCIDYIVRYTPEGAELAYSTYRNTVEKYPMQEPFWGSGIFGNVHYYDEQYNSNILNCGFMKYHNPVIAGHNGYKRLLYMHYSLKHAAVEKLVKAGYDDIIENIIDGNMPYKSVINLDGKTLPEIFRMNGSEFADMKKFAENDGITTPDLQLYKKLKSLGRASKRKYTFTDVAIVEKIAYQSYITHSDVMKVLKQTGLTPTKLKNYLDVKLPACRFNYHHAPCKDYIDYLAECSELGYDLTDSQINRPSDFYEAHDRTANAVMVLKKEQEEKKRRKETTAYLEGIYKKLVTKYEYAEGNYMIIVPRSAAEIISEGERLRHCVAGYANRHMCGKLAILFMRDANAPNVPLYTIEMQGNTCIQIRGRRNCAPTPVAKLWFDNWLKQLTTKKSINKSIDKTA